MIRPQPPPPLIATYPDSFLKGPSTLRISYFRFCVLRAAIDLFYVSPTRLVPDITETNVFTDNTLLVPAAHAGLAEPVHGHIQRGEDLNRLTILGRHQSHAPSSSAEIKFVRALGGVLILSVGEPPNAMTSAGMLACTNLPLGVLSACESKDAHTLAVLYAQPPFCRDPSLDTYPCHLFLLQRSLCGTLAVTFHAATKKYPRAS